MKHNQKKKAAPLRKARPSSTTNDPKHTQRGGPAQLHFNGFPPPPEPGEGTVEAYLRARPGWHDSENVAIALMLPDREVRLQSERSNGLIIFGSGSGLKHIVNADGVEARACVGELRARAASHHRRADEIESRLREMEGRP